MLPIGNMKNLPPPRVPKTKEDLERAIVLLGSVSNGQKLRQKQAKELEQLLGFVPKPDNAKAWKSELKRLRAEVLWNV